MRYKQFVKICYALFIVVLVGEIRADSTSGAYLTRLTNAALAVVNYGDSWERNKAELSSITNEISQMIIKDGDLAGALLAEYRRLLLSKGRLEQQTHESRRIFDVIEGILVEFCPTSALGVVRDIVFDKSLERFVRSRVLSYLSDKPWQQHESRDIRDVLMSALRDNELRNTAIATILQTRSYLQQVSKEDAKLFREYALDSKHDWLLTHSVRDSSKQLLLCDVGIISKDEYIDWLKRVCAEKEVFSHKIDACIRELITVSNLSDEEEQRLRERSTALKRNEAMHAERVVMDSRMPIHDREVSLRALKRMGFHSKEDIDRMNKVLNDAINKDKPQNIPITQETGTVGRSSIKGDL